MSILRFTLDMEPKSLQQGAHRQAARLDGNGKPYVHRYSTKEANTFKQTVAMLASVHRPREPLSGALRTVYRFVLPRPKYLCKKNIPAGRLLCPVKPDYTNLAKHFEDVLTKARFWHDDGQLADARSIKFYAAVGERPCIEVEIEAFAAFCPGQRQISLFDGKQP